MTEPTPALPLTMQHEFDDEPIYIVAADGVTVYTVLAVDDTESRIIPITEALAHATLLVTAINNYEALKTSLKTCIENHCPNDKLFCGSCTPARELLKTLEGQ